MGKSAALLLVVAFLTASCLMVIKPALSIADVAENSWASKAPMHQARSGLGAAVVDGKIYAIGGLTRSGSQSTYSGGVVGTNEEYDPATNTWTYKTSMPHPRDYFAIGAYQKKIYCIGSGINEVYDPATDMWETKTPMPTSRYGAQANVVNGKIYLIGGYIAGNSSLRSTINEVYDPATDSWTTKSPMPTVTFGCVSAIVDNKIYFVSGLERTQIYDTETDSWSLGASPPSSVYHGYAVATSGVMAPKMVYVLGISGHQSFSEPEYFVRIYNPEKDSWTFGVDIPTKRLDFCVGAVNDRLYVIGGNTLDYPENFNPSLPSLVQYATVEEYTPFGYGTVPPAVSIISLESMATYASSDVPLNFSLNKPVTWIGYSLDGKDNITVTGNTTITGLSTGLHNITVYAKDAFENTGTSETITFNVAPEPFPTTLVATASVASVAVVGVCLLVYFKKRNHKH